MPRKKLEERELAKIVFQVLSLGRKEELHSLAVQQVIKGACWWASDLKGKHDKCPYWSSEAAKLRESWNTCPKGTRWPDKHALVQDHVIPRECLKRRLLGLEKVTMQSVQEVLGLSIGCYITQKEEAQLSNTRPSLKQKMPREWTWGDDTWARYRAANIKLHEGQVEFPAKPSAIS